MINSIKSGDYELTSCTQIDNNTGRIEFEPFGWPYGGVGCLHMLIKAFEGVVIKDHV
jgi:hypothetical protein